MQRILATAISHVAMKASLIRSRPSDHGCELERWNTKFLPPKNTYRQSATGSYERIAIYRCRRNPVFDAALPVTLSRVVGVDTEIVSTHSHEPPRSPVDYTSSATEAILELESLDLTVSWY